MKKIIYLESLRGYAALIVVFTHFGQLIFPGFVAGGISHTDWEDPIRKTPFNLLFNGSFAVFIFFVLSGYVLSLKYQQTGDKNILYSLMKKRYLRLSIPVLFSILLFYLFKSVHAFYFTDYVNQHPYVGIYDYTSLSLDWKELFYFSFFEVMFLGETVYNPVLWTMKWEFFGSIILFLILIATHHSTPRTRKWLLVLLSMLSVIALQSPFAAFFMGSFLAFSNPLQHTYQKMVLFLVGIYFSSYPPGETANSIYNWIALPTEPIVSEFAYHFIGSFFLLYVIISSNTIQKILHNKLGKALGNISFSLYLTHFTFLLTLPCWWLVKNPLSLSIVWNTTIGFMIFLIGSIFIAYLFYYLVEKPLLYGLRKWK